MRAVYWTLLVILALVVALFIYSAAAACSLPSGKVDGIGNWPDNVPRITDPSRYSFAFIGDVNNIGIQNLIAYLKIAAQRNDVSFIILGGDFYRRPSDSVFRYSLGEIKRAGISKPILTVPGNHDLIPKGTGKSDPALFEKFCGRTVMSFTVGDDLFMICKHIDAERVTAPDLPGVQASSMRHKIVLSHAPWFNFDEMPDNFKMGADVESENMKIAKAIGASVILCGHVDRFSTFEKEGIKCVVVGGGPSKKPNSDVVGMVIVTASESGITIEPVPMQTKFDFFINLRRWLYVGPISGIFESTGTCVLLALAAFAGYVFVCKRLFYDKNVSCNKS